MDTHSARPDQQPEDVDQFVDVQASDQSAPGPAPATSYWYHRDITEPAPAPRPPVQVIERPRPRRMRRAAVIGTTTALALVAGFGGGWLATQSKSPTASAVDTSLSQQSGAAPVSAKLSATADPVEEVAAAVLPSVVSILATSGSSAGEGSGVILTSTGLILTNNHVIDGASTLTVQFSDGTTASATVVGADATDDIAVIKADNVSGLTAATLGTSPDLEVGQAVVAIGAPLGLSSSVTSGIVSALNRPVATSSETQQGTAATGSVINAIQTDAAINPGNSGGPLVNLSGQVIGINSAIASLSSGSSQSGSIGLGFSIPIDQAARIAQELIDTGKATTATLNISVTDNATDRPA